MGDPSNVRVWNRIEVWVGKVAAPATPADGDTDLADTDWDLVGLIDPAGFEDTPEISSQAIKDYTGKTIRRVNEDFAYMVAFTALESSDVVRGLAWPGSDGTKIVVPEHEQVFLAIELFDGTTRERRITAVGAQVTNVEPVTKTRTVADATKITAEVIAAADGTLFNLQTGTVS